MQHCSDLGPHFCCNGRILNSAPCSDSSSSLLGNAVSSSPQDPDLCFWAHWGTMGHPWLLLGAGADTGYGCLITPALCQPNIPNFNAFSLLQRWTESKLVVLNVPVRYYFLLIRWSAKSQNTEQKQLSHPQETSPHRCLQQGQIKTFCPARGFAPPRSLQSEVSWEFTMHVDCGCLQAPRWV